MTLWGSGAAHELVVDAYADSHSGDGRDRRDRQSVFVHLVALCARLGHPDFPLLERVAPGPLTVHDLVGCDEFDSYTHRAEEWACSVWRSFEPHHLLIRQWWRRDL